jgi:hypothetical protein
MGDLLSRPHPVRARRRGAFVVVCASLGAMLFACASVLGIEDKPLRVEVDSAPSVDGGPDTGDGGVEASCNLLESHACTDTCPRDFCDDFDGDGQAPETRWTTPLGLQNPFVRGDSGVTLTLQADSPPKALSATATSAGSVSYGMLANVLSFDEKHKGQAFDGVRVAFDFRVDELTSTGNGGPVKDAGNAAMLGMLRSDVVKPLKGIAVVLSGTTMALDVSDDVLGSGATSSEVLATIAEGLDLSFIKDNWIQLELFVGDRDRAITLGYAKCSDPTVMPGLVAAAGLAGKKLGTACVDIPASFGTADWAQFPVMLAGSLLFSAGAAAFRIDNVSADFYVK